MGGHDLEVPFELTAQIHAEPSWRCGQIPLDAGGAEQAARAAVEEQAIPARGVAMEGPLAILPICSDFSTIFGTPSGDFDDF